MLPSRGLRPAQLSYTAARHPMTNRSCPSRKFSSLPRTAGLSPPCRASPLQSARWRTGATRSPNVVFTASTVRNWSWYAPWSWGKSSTKSGDASAATVDHVPIAEISNSVTPKVVEQPVVTTATPELAPAGIDQPAVVDTTSSSIDAKTMDDLLSLEPTKDVLSAAATDHTSLITHAGQLKEMGLDYGWGMTTILEKAMEQIYLTTGWGWAGSIMLTAVLVRGATFFFQALSSDRMAGLAALKPLTEPLQKKMEEAIARGDQQQVTIYKMQQAQIMKPHLGGIFSMAGFVVIQGWIGFCAFRLLRALASLPVPGMSQDGFLWFTDLTVRDPYYILPAATTAIFFAIFRAGGETGVQNDVGSQAQTRKTLMTAMSFVFGAITAFQASALQIYFLGSGVLGALTAFLLRQNSFRRLIRIRPLPSKESQEVFSKVANGELKLADIKGKDGKIRYQAPTRRAPANTRSSTTIAGLNLRAGTTVPLHLRPETPKKAASSGPKDRDDDWETGAQGGILQKLDWTRRNYRPSYVFRRMSSRMESMARQAGYGGKKMSEQEEKRKRRAEAYELERKRRFEQR